MVRVVLRRLSQLGVTLIALMTLIFFWLRSLPGGPVDALLGERATPQTRETLTRALGYDQPIWVQYGRFLRNVVTGDFGNSIRTGEPVADVISRAFPATVELALAAIVIAVGLGIPLGYLAARHHGRLLDNATIVVTLVGISVPIFFLGYLLKDWLTQGTHLFPPSGRISTGVENTGVTGFFVLDGLLTREWDASADALWHLILPAVTLATIPLAIIVRITRAGVLDVLDEDYVRTADAKGLRNATIRKRHVLRNALLPVVTTIGLQTGTLLAGAVLTEKVYNWGGLGTLITDSISGSRDYPVLQALILLAAVVFIVVNLLVDLSYAVIDPRVRVR
ncbi:peptide ABC transporter permease [Actinoplanes cyaneus]|jgi:peptide/nickel transport system permease protein|uniref:Peptide ABC transporter permease n=1 Tax=Actinoplanes cyaneus TaxID=52696 RepID=A0A919M3N0_9ACTN|nr:ABC transporter permease [Actinoplanes cyaneus]MCW2138073.1 peptide/nickel transport system permease protein [Actinoplanes cyaneus]GID64717.1 peptide ABC transporter permease [Actinoplanes cyaneus]